jgi:hypothetical protein
MARIAIEKKNEARFAFMNDNGRKLNRCEQHRNRGLRSQAEHCKGNDEEQTPSNETAAELPSVNSVDQNTGFMKRTMILAVIAVSLAAPVLLTTGCAVTSGRETAGAYANDKEIAAKIKTTMYKDPIVKGTQVEVQCLQGVVQLSGFVETQEAKERAGAIAASTRGVVNVHNDLLLPTGR